MMIGTDVKTIIDFTLSLISQSRLLIEQSNKLIDKSQKIIADETAKEFERDSARRKRKRSSSPV